ncbi:hypothetical protein ZHAS_00020194 [Anopheles sinensis]|uniref:Mediator of RNA polymerase II transcription subunit 13 n=1 Tax=Anopheles sinensis TaxID=74873 RepID=A0A084WP71_ANOSI|nr:hypothetical protein ZHAS_00020194 [Anopheles sinensis]
MRCLALSVFSQSRKYLAHMNTVKSLTGFGTAANAEQFMKSKDDKNRVPYRLYTPPYVLAKSCEKSENTEAFGKTSLKQQCSIMYCSYCLSEDQSWLLAVATDDRGEFLETVTINIDIPNRGRRKRASARRYGLQKLMDFILGLISQTVQPWRLVVGRIGRIGHGELKGWSWLLSKPNLQRASKNLKDICEQCALMHPISVPSILSACLVTLEPDSDLRVMSDQFTPDERFSQRSMQSPLSTPQDATCTHILVFPTSAKAQSAQASFSVIGELDLGEDLNMVIMDGDDDDDGINMLDVFRCWDDIPMQQINMPHSRPGSPSQFEGNQQSPGESKGAGARDGYGAHDSEEVGVVLQQPLAIGYLVSTAPTGRMPAWFWSSCPHMENVCPVFLRTALHLHTPTILQNTDDPLQQNQSSTEHPLDSNITADVLRYVLEGYNLLSWLAMDSNTHDRLSCLPIHVQVLMQLYHMTAALASSITFTVIFVLLPKNITMLISILFCKSVENFSTEEFVAVYNKIFQSAADDIEAMENSIQWLNVWKVRQTKDIPICIRCTLAVLEARLFDLRSQRDGRENTTETKNIYAGAFTRFINFITEGSVAFRFNKATIADFVRGQGIETYMVELRHLCAHKSISVSIDVFRRSAQYCMDWLKVSYWERELALIQPVTIFTNKTVELRSTIKYGEMITCLRQYDVVSGGRASGFETVPELKAARKDDKDLQLLDEFDSTKLKVISESIVKHLREKLRPPPTSAGVRALCKSVLANCRRLLLYPPGWKEEPSVSAIYSDFFQYLAEVGCLQPFLEQLLAICENEAESDELRRGAQYWALKIAVGFRLLAQFKKTCKSLPAAQLIRFHQIKCPVTKKRARVVYTDFVNAALKTPRYQLVLGLTVDCPWHLNLSRVYLLDRLAAVNPYTREVVTVLLSLAQPTVKQSLQRKMTALMQTYTGEKVRKEDEMEFTKKITAVKSRSSKATDEELADIYTKEDFVKMVASKKRPAEERLEGQPETKRWGPWSESRAPIAWSSCPLGTYHIVVAK